MIRRLCALLLALMMLCTAGLAEVASGDEVLVPEEVVEEGMTPVDGTMLRDGTYSAVVNSSSSMFKIVACELTVQDGQMTATITMSGTGYLKLFMGTGEEAVAAGEEDSILAVEDAEGACTFTMPVPALDAAIDCAAFSKRKEKWYDRQILFRADSLPLEAFQEGALTTAESLGLADGLYTVEAALVGDAGKTSVESPAQLRVEGGAAYATVVWSSKNYDYMRIGEKEYLPLDTEGNAAFEIPVSCFDWNLAVIADSTALGAPIEMSYSIRFDSSTIQPAE